MVPDYLASIEFLKAFHPNRRWVLTAISTDKRTIETATFDEKRAYACTQWLEKQGATRNIYFSLGEIGRDVSKKAERTDIDRVWYLHVDVDPRAGEDIEAERKRALDLLSNPPGGLPAPTFIVFSGGGYQAFWQLDQPIAIDCELAKAEDTKRYNLQIEILCGGDSCHNVDRIMRLPGTINRPDPVKLKKGRKEVLSTLVLHNPSRVYPLGKFNKAPEVQTGAAATPGGYSTPSAGVQVKVSGNIRRLNDINELPDGMSNKGKIVIVQGFDPDEPNKFQGRSEWLFYACCEMIRGGCDDDTIYSVITDPGFAISASVLDKGSMTEKYALRQIARAKEEAVDPWLRKLNEQFAVISNWSGKCRVVEEQYDEVMARHRLTKQTFEDFRNRWMHIQIVVGQNEKSMDILRPLGEWWLRNDKRRQFDKLIFAPARDVPNAYNLWRGFACEAVPGDCSLFLTHLKDNICRGEADHYRYLLGWMARAVQHPDSPGYASVVFRGGQGTGKSFVSKTFGSLFGRHYMQVTDPKHLVGSFNAHLRDCVVLFGDEAFYAGDKKHESILKMLITEEMITIEAKGVDAEVAGNCIHLMMASNEAWVVPAGMDDRRFFVLDVGDGAKGKGDYFQAISDQMNAGGREALLHYLMTYDLKGFDVRSVPKTAALQEQKLFSMGTTEGWWFEKLRDGRMLSNHIDWRGKITIYDIQEDYLGYCRQFNVQRRGTAFALRQLLEKFCGKGWPRKFQTQEPIEYIDARGEKKMATRPYWYEFPDLKTCQDYWDANFGGPYTWHTLEIEAPPPTAPAPF
jgi:hypothetical protein